MNSSTVFTSIECVTLISDDDTESSEAPAAKVVKDGAPGHIRRPSSIIGTDDGDGRRVSRRKKNKVEYFEISKTGETPAGGVPSGDPTKGTLNAGVQPETRSRKSDQRPSTPTHPTRDPIDPITYKEILTGLEGAAFQSRLPCDKMVSKIF